MPIAAFHVLFSIQVNIRVRGHVCELQLHMIDFWKIKQQGGHAHYRWVREQKITDEIDPMALVPAEYRTQRIVRRMLDVVIINRLEGNGDILSRLYQELGLLDMAAVWAMRSFSCVNELKASERYSGLTRQLTIGAGATFEVDVDGKPNGDNDCVHPLEDSSRVSETSVATNSQLETPDSQVCHSGSNADAEVACEASSAKGNEQCDERERSLKTWSNGDQFVMMRLSNILLAQGKFTVAEQLSRRVLEARACLFGEKHPDTLKSINYLANTLRMKGKFSETETLYRKALSGRFEVLGPTHPDTLTSTSNLATMLESQGKLEEAKLLHERALEGREKVFGLRHPDTL